MCEDFSPNFDDKITGCCITATLYLTLLFSPGFFFTKINMPAHSQPPYFYLLPRLKMKLKGHYFDTIEVIEAELQAVLNTLTEHDFQDAFKKWYKLWERCMRVERDYFEDDGGR
jgi:hypothetical protein